MIRQYFGFYGPMILAWGLGKPFIHVGGVEHAEVYFLYTDNSRIIIMRQNYDTFVTFFR